MALRFQKRIKLGKGFGLNLSKSGISSSFRTKRGSISKKGVSVKTGIPGLTFRKSFKNSGCLASILVYFFMVVGIVSCSVDNCRCSDFETQSQAQVALIDGCDELDRDNDGIACENLPD